MGKTRLIATPIATARTRHHLAPSRISAPLVLLGRMLLPAYLRYALLFESIELRDENQFVEAIRDFQEHRTRLIIAFRHPYGDEPQLLFHVFENMIPKRAKKMRDPLKRQPNVRPVHDYAVPLWGDALIRFLLPRVGALPVYHTKCDASSLSNIRNVLRDGCSPLALAPEGQISYHSETLPRIELGTVRMGFWCASDMEKTNRPERVVILPLSVHYQYDPRDLNRLLKSIRRLEHLCDTPSDRSQSIKSVDMKKIPRMVLQKNASMTEIAMRLLPHVEDLERRILDSAERYYADTYGYKPVWEHQSQEEHPIENESIIRQQRWDALLPFALGVAEHALGLDPGEETLVQRMYRVRLEGWERIYPQSPVDRLAPLEAALADRRAGEGWFAMRHMELVDLMSYHDVNYASGILGDSPSFDRLVETVYSLEDLANRLMGGNISNRPNIMRKRAILLPAPCIDLSSRMADYRVSPKKAVGHATEELVQRFQNCITRYQNETTR